VALGYPVSSNPVMGESRTGSRLAVQRPIARASGARVAPTTAGDVRSAVCTETAGQGGVAVTAGRRAPQCPAPRLLHTPQLLHPARALGVAVALLGSTTAVGPPPKQDDGPTHSAGHFGFGRPEAGDIADEDVVRAESASVGAACRRVGDPLPGSRLHQLTQHVEIL
jgi:hypothetical protein